MEEWKNEGKNLYIEHLSMSPSFHVSTFPEERNFSWLSSLSLYNLCVLSLINQSMEVTVYNSERFDRGTRWYVIFGAVFAGIFLLTIFNQNYIWAVLLFFLLGGYFYYSSVHAQVTTITVQTDGVKIGKNFVWYSSLTGYALELHHKSELLKNIVFVSAKGHAIYTFHDAPERIKDFILALDRFLPMLDKYDQGGFEKLIRGLQL